MKVNGPSNLSGPSKARKPGQAGSADGFAPLTPGTQSTASSNRAPVSAASAVGSVDALLALQAADPVDDARQQATDRAFSVLDILDDLKIALLEGRIERETLARLMDTLKSERQQTQDPHLESMLDEIELRAAVELAKHGG
jgi:hypothetical protein